MKATFLFLSALFLLTISAFGQEPEWKWQNPKPTMQNLMDVHFLTSQIGIAVGSKGLIMRSIDGGESWQNIDVGLTNDFYSVHFSDSLHGWIVGKDGAILSTENGGNHWDFHSTGTTTTLNSVFLVDQNKVIIAGEGGKVLRTTDGGSSWSTQVLSPFSILKSCYFIDSLTGWIAGGPGGIAYFTNNGGETWVPKETGANYFIASVFFISNQVGWVVGGNGTIRKTVNGGSSWYQQNMGNDQITINSIVFVNNQTGWIVGTNGSIYKSTNGGTSWKPLPVKTRLNIFSVFFKSDSSGIAVGASGSILATNGFSQPWKSIGSVTGFDLESVFFYNHKIGWATGNSGTIVRTQDGGKNWELLNSGISLKLFSIHFPGPQTGWVVGANGIILKTNDWGKTWVPQNSGTSHYLNSVFFTDPQNGWATGFGGIILNTTNGGSNWNLQAYSGINFCYSIQFINPFVGWIVGSEGTIQKTTNKGANWIFQNSPTTRNLYSLYFINEQTGWAVGANGTIIKTNNGGISWQTQNSGVLIDIQSVRFINQNFGWAVVKNGSILTTSNGGITWQSFSFGIPQNLTSIHCFDKNRCWIVGSGGAIISNISGQDNNPGPPKSLVGGLILQKPDPDCIPNLSAPKIPGIVVKALPGPYFGISNSNGSYKIEIPVGSQIVNNFNLFAKPFQFQSFQGIPVCPEGNIYELELDSLPDTLSGHHFGFEITPCHHLEVQIASNRRRRCFRNITNVSYRNQGTVLAQNAYVLVEFPKWVRGISASASYTILNDSTWRFDLGEVGPGNGGQIVITDSVICGFPNIRNLNQCTKAIIYPAPNCITTGGWTGAEVSVNGQCLNGIVDFGVYNATNHDMTDSLDYWIYLDSIQVKVGKIKLAANDSLHFWVQTNGMSATFTVNQVVGHPLSEFESSLIEACSDSTFFPRQMANHFPKSNSPIKKYHCLPILDSFDPNDKLAFPIGFTANRIVKPGTEMEYLIRFQNTGNDTAYSVIVVDSLDNNLDVESLKMGAVSHLYDITLETAPQGRNILRFQFNHIMLPDSNTNESKSHGFIQYRISPKADLALGSRARNAAEIYFDFNLPVVTNNTLTTFDNVTFTNPALNNNVQIISSSKPPYLQGGKVQVFPNPFSGLIQIRSEREDQITIIMSDMLGKEVFAQRILGSKELNVGHLPAGIYLLTIPELNRKVKVVKER